MLKTRVITAVVLLAVLLPVLFQASPWPFAWVTVAMMGAAGWEWARLNGLPGTGAIAAGVALALACVWTLLIGGLNAPPAWLWSLASLVWVLGGAYALRAGPAGWPRIARGGRLALGALLLWGAWLAIVQAKVHGINFILSVFCLVWMADIAAYFCGRAFGRRKLAPAISPGKSWEGVWGGLAGVILLGFVWVHVIDVRLAVDSPSLYTLLVQRHGVVSLLALVFLAAMSVVGDLFESLVKRAVGAKDSSGLLPGHGGVLDRIDALLPVFPLALALISL
ncbi:phosphatidate cytidylyltransferase [Pelomonas aquatica]|jgi:phosphatidate cytidylyltransferase|uniref:Phosphatidate cytidylyltransferase n=1 Tax=Pelomonas aquatica TaxID=431058 RepID=A0A9X4LG85_9BURK|nr:phosphatidate cytidylyltransferase [Pelomonas aquatica]MCY4754725.1 phosphatidate cytidylyltransferase [Pelomonas aquatica]MDG0861962.1 phosphatidate cytidylyltransferase [Pelomonas aquatica]